MSPKTRKLGAGDHLREWRVRADLTQAAVARSLDYSTSQFVSNWERGVSMPPLQALPKLTALYNVTPSEIVDVFRLHHEEVWLQQKRKILELFRKGLSRR